MSNLREIEKLIQKEQIVKAVVGNYVIYRRDWLQDNIEQEYILQKSAAAFNKKFGIEELKRLIDQERKFGVVRLFVRNEKSGHLSAKGSYDLCPECYSQIEKMLYGPETD